MGFCRHSMLRVNNRTANQSVSRASLVWCLRNNYTFAAMDFGRRLGASDEHIPKWICKERATTPPPKRHAALRVALKLAWGFVAQSVEYRWGYLPAGRQALPPSRLAQGQFERNECIVISETPHQSPPIRTQSISRAPDRVPPDRPNAHIAPRQSPIQNPPRTPLR